MADITDRIALEIKGGTQTADTGIKVLIDDLKKLKQGIDTNLTGTNNLQNQLKTLGIDLNNSKLKETITSINSDILKYNTSSGQMVTINRKIKDGVNDYTVSMKELHNQIQESNVQKIAKEFGTLDSQLEKLGVSDIDLSKPISSIKTINSETTKYKTKTNEVVTVVKKSKDGIDSYTVSVKELNNQLNRGTSLWSAFTKGASGLLVKANILWGNIKKGVSVLDSLTKSAYDYEEVLNLFTASMGDNAKQAKDWIDTFSTALYLDPANIMQYMGSLNSLISGLGVGADKSYLMSKNLTQLAYDLSSFKNMKFDEAFTKLQSGISGKIICLVCKGLHTVTYLIQWTSKHIMV